jgi:glycosyltransferase involved in cell wall biosynthesis
LRHSDTGVRVRLVGLLAGGYSGVPRYAAMLTRGLDRVAKEFPMLQMTLVTTERGAAETSPRHLQVHVPAGPLKRLDAGPGRIVVEQALAVRGEADLLYFFQLNGPLLAPSRPFVATAHDARAAYEFVRARWRYKRRLYPWALQRARTVVAVSQFAKDEIVRHFGAEPSKVHVIHSGPGLEAGEVVEPPASPASPPYLLYLGALDGNKNLLFLVDAFERSGMGADLLLAGRGGGDFGSLRRAVDASPARDRIRIAQNVTDGEADGLYRGALALVHPSMYEGFGFTPLEAMARGCPVLASDIPAIREVSGSGAMLLPLEDAAAWSDGMRRVVDDGKLRSELRTKGAATVSRYSWDETARGVCRLLLSVSGRDAR